VINKVDRVVVDGEVVDCCGGKGGLDSDGNLKMSYDVGYSYNEMTRKDGGLVEDLEDNLCIDDDSKMALDDSKKNQLFHSCCLDDKVEDGNRYELKEKEEYHKAHH